MALDRFQQWRYGVHEFNHHPQCIIRVSGGHSHATRTLADGTQVQAGDPIVEIHCWNEHIPPLGPDGPTVAWGVRLGARLRLSMRALACHLEGDPALRDVHACVGELTFASHHDRERFMHAYSKLGFDFYERPLRGFWDRLGCFFAQMYVRTLIWTVNPGGVPKTWKWSTLHQVEIWMSRRTLRERFGEAPEKRSANPRE